MAAISALVAKPNTRPCFGSGTTRCSTVCSAASAIGISAMYSRMPTAISQMCSRSVKPKQMIHMTTFASSRLRNGRGPSPLRATHAPPTRKPKLSTPHMIPQASTDIRVRP